MWHKHCPLSLGKISTGSRYSGCTFVEHFGFSVDEALLRAIAENYKQDYPVAWRFKYKAKAAEDWQDGMMPTEVAGLLIAVDNYKMKIGIAK